MDTFESVYAEDGAALAEVALFDTPPVGLALETRGEVFSGIFIIALVACAAALMAFKKRPRGKAE